MRVKHIAISLICAVSIMMAGCSDVDSKSVISGTENDKLAQSQEANENSDEVPNEDKSLNEKADGNAGSKTDNNTVKKADKSDNEEASEPETITNPVQKYSKLSTWVAYWDYADAIEQINALGDELDTIVCFEALYGSDGRTILHPEGCDELLNILKTNYGNKKTIYLSYTNDFQNPDGSYTQKSVDLLRAAFSSEAAIEQYSSDMVKDAKASGVDGLELDYENMRKDDSLFTGYALFVNSLAKKCNEAGLSFRVATEYQTGIKCQLTDGPEYVVMCYNLYGYGTEPGPKANAEYLVSCFNNFAYLSHVNFAFSLGGFKWNNGNVSAVTENEALALLAASGAAIEYEPSGGAHFAYTEADGSISEVYYADANTIVMWKNLLRSQGADNFSLWRMGGNNIESLRGMK